MIKTLLVLSGAVLLAVPALHAQDHRSFGGGRALASHGYYNGNRGNGYGRNHHYGRYYYFGGVPYFYPFYGYGFGYGGYGFDGGYGYGDGFAGPYGYGYGNDGYNGGPNGAGGPYEGRLTDNGANNGQVNNGQNGAPSNSGPSLPEAVQRQLSKKGYYKGGIDGQFGPASRSALSRFQRDNNLKETGRIDEETLDALGFTDHR